jgi:hypothetical protein
VQDVRGDDQAFEDDDEAVKSEDHSQTPPLIVSAEGNGEDGADEGDHASEGWDDLEQTAEDGPEERPGNVNQPEADEPEDAYDECVEGSGSPPMHEGCASGFEVRGGVAFS